MPDKDALPQSSDGPRLTPYELVFTEGDFESRTFPRISREAAEEGIVSLHRERFEFLSTVGEVVREVTPDDAPPDAIEQYRSLLFHAYHQWSEGHRLFVLDTATARYLVESAPSIEEWRFVAPARSLYLQLPANLFWSSISPETPPEPVDGFFVTSSSGTDGLGKDFENVDILAVLGIRRSRAGFSVIPVEMEVGDGVPPAWEGPRRPEGDFANALPGGELTGLYSMLTTTEVLKLVARTFWYIEQFPENLEEVLSPEPREEGDEAPPTQLAYTRVTIGSAPSEDAAPAEG